MKGDAPVEIANEEALCSDPQRIFPNGADPRGIRNVAVSSEFQSRPRVDEAQLADYFDAAERYRPQLLRVAARVTNRHEDAEDIVQLALLKAFRNLSMFRRESQMKTWLTAIVRNAALENVRNQRERAFVPISCVPSRDGARDELELPDLSLNAEERYAHKERHEIFSAAINCMNRVNRRALKMCILEEFSHIQAATLLGVPLSTVKSRIFRGKRQLRTAISSRTNQIR
jgi:RNA polymerase sigma-70 factor (ECF subfamily)